MLIVCYLFSEFLAFAVGGWIDAEVFSPDGNCQFELARIPSGALEPVLAFIHDMILACAGKGNKNCHLYSPTNNTWSRFSTSNFTHDYQPGEIYNGKIYIADDKSPEVLDPVSNSWSRWPAPLNKTGESPCLVAWKDSFILLGGSSNRRGVQTFNHSSNKWHVLDSTAVPMDIYFSSCILLPSEEILVVGSEEKPFKSSVSLYHIQSNTWSTLPNTTYPKNGAGLVTLEKRVFAIDGHYGNIVEEFIYADATWKLMKAKLSSYRHGHLGVISLPAELFEKRPDECL